MAKRKRRRLPVMTKKQWDEVVAKYPPGLYAVYGPSGEKEWMVRGYTETPCGVVGVWMVDPDDIKHCVVYWFKVRLVGFGQTS